MNDAKLYSCSGKIEYRGTWIICAVSQTIMEYYHAMAKKHLHLPKLNKPYNAAHITVVAGKYEDLTTHSRWKLHQGREINIAYNSFLTEMGGYFWLEVVSPELTEIRRELGLTDIPKHPFHITIGNLKNVEA